MKQEQDAPAAAKVDPVEEICQALFATEEGAKKEAARKAVGGMTQRPWQQLPSRLRSAIRSDVGHLADQKKTREQIVALGYSTEILGQALRDLGKKIA
ncbi:hypothetical protein FA04_13845 [Ensifer adhaerens]|uniref:Uncharacterized protein n=1 Tax=Ensifer adhaerens TaxID=106592 RepID=A0ABY8HCB1_ENSAD|nr:hypothetical protein [Ensifer adhaerens]ANK73606.1 hypothetical protein FA04_13845 [Ensifer adhaerens]KDP73632.1 hypothetical protein FA04_11045 [Ensifer adhaerens]WFP89682.1 hypothetical protein P4B07_14070 [Ensifer adhaerens]